MWQLIENSQANTSDTESNLQGSKHPFVTEATHNARQSRKQSLKIAKETSGTNNKCSFNFDSEEFVNSARSLNKLSRSQSKKRKKLNCDSENKNSDILYDRNKKDKLKSGDESCEKKNRKYSKKRRSVQEQESKITSTSIENTNYIIPNAKKSEGNEYTDRYFQYFALSSTEDMMEEIDRTHQKGMSENKYKCVDQNNGCSSGNKKRKTYPAENKIVKSKCQSKVKSNKLSKLKKRMNSCDKNFSRSRENDSGQNDSHDTSTSSSCILISHSADDSSGSEDIIPNTPPCSDEFHVLKSRNEDSLFSAALVSTTNPKKKKLPTSHQKLSSEAVDVETDRNAMRSSTENYLKTEKHSAKSCKKINKLSAKSRNRKKREKFTSVESESKTGSGDTDIHSEYLYRPMLDEDGEHSKTTEEASAIPRRSKHLASCSTETSSESSKRKETKEKKVKSNDLYGQLNSLESKEENSEMGTHTQRDQSLRLSHLTLEQIEEKFEKNIQYLRDIFKGKQYCERHEKFNRGGFECLNLRYSALFTVPYTDDQLYHLLFLICSTYCPRGNFHRFYDYFMKVLLPEICIKIYMDEFSVSYDVALTQMDSIPEEAIHGFCLSW